MSMILENQLLATKFYVPVAFGTLISRPRLSALLAQSLKHPLTLISAPAGFGKTTLLSMWAQSLPANQPLLAWVSLDEEDNEPQSFWTYVLTALNKQRPKHFTPLLEQLQSPQAPPLKFLLKVLINMLVETTDQFLLILDDYHLITEQQVHTTLSYLVEHLPPQLCIIVATRTDPPLPLSHLRVYQHLLEVRTDQLRCTAEETGAFFHQVMGVQLPEEVIQKVTARTEGWLVGLQLLGLSLSEQADPLTILEEVSGDQRYILDYLTEEVLRRQPQEVQTFLLSTCILERFTASLCDAVMQQTGSQRILQQLEQANLFVVSLDRRREWYRYHALFAQALRTVLEHTQSDLVPTLHHRASLWYAQHDQITQAILHAFSGNEWHWAADLIERKSLQVRSLTWGTAEHELALFQQWLDQLPADIMRSRPRLCMACSQLLWQVAPHAKLHGWLDAAEAALIALFRTQTPADDSHPIPTPEVRKEQDNQLGEVTTFRAVVRSHEEDGQVALMLCQSALILLSAENFGIRAYVCYAQLRALYVSTANDAVAAVQSGLQAGLFAQTAGSTVHAISLMGTTAMHMIGAGQLHEASQLTKQAILLGKQPGGLELPDVGWPSLFQGDILREWNQLDAALSLARKAISLCQQTETIGSLTYRLLGYAMLLRIFLSRGELDAACSALQQFEHISRRMNQPISLHYRSLFTTVDQVKLWLACGELDRAMGWAQKLEVAEQYGTPFAHEREDVAHARILLANNQPTLALERLESVLQRATTGKRWGHVIEIRLLQALALEMSHKEMQALAALSEAIRLAQPEGYIRSFVDEGTPMAALLSRLRKEQSRQGPTPYLDTVLAAFPKQSNALPELLSEREQEVLQLLALGTSNQEIAQELVIVVDTVKRHVSHIFAKLGAKNRVQAIMQAREFGLLDEEL